MTHSFVWHDSFIWVTWPIHLCGMTRSYVWHDSFICETWLIDMGDMPHSFVWQDSFIWVTWLIQLCATTHSYAWHDSFICVPWLIQMGDLTRFYVWRDACLSATWLMPTRLWVMSRIDLSLFPHMNEQCLQYKSVRRHGSCLRGYDVLNLYHIRIRDMTQTWLDLTCDMTHSYGWHHSFLCVTWLVFMCDMTHSYAWLDSCIHGYNILCR